MVWDCYSSTLSILVDFMASTLPAEKEACFPQSFYYVGGCYSRELFAHTATSKEVRLTDSA